MAIRSGVVTKQPDCTLLNSVTTDHESLEEFEITGCVNFFYFWRIPRFVADARDVHYKNYRHLIPEVTLYC